MHPALVLIFCISLIPVLPPLSQIYFRRPPQKEAKPPGAAAKGQVGETLRTKYGTAGTISLQSGVYADVSRSVKAKLPRLRKHWPTPEPRYTARGTWPAPPVGIEGGSEPPLKSGLGSLINPITGTFAITRPAS